MLVPLMATVLADVIGSRLRGEEQLTESGKQLTNNNTYNICRMPIYDHLYLH
jgi:hypothetical protein